MKKMLNITKLISENTKEEIYVFLDCADFKKYAFVKKGNLFIPYDDKKLLGILNNSDKVMYHQSIEEENQETNMKKNKLTLKEKVQRTLAGLGVAVTIVTCIPSATEIASYSLKKVRAMSVSTSFELDENNSQFVSQVEQALSKTSIFTEEEQEIIIKGFQRYIDDWGYLFNETDKKYLISMCERLELYRDSWMPPWAVGSYSMGNIRIESGKDNKCVVSHEACHAFSDKGLLNGTISGYAFGYALNEGINTSVNDYYYIKEEAYENFCKHVLKLSLLIDNEVLIEAYQKKGPEHIVRSIVEQNPNISATDVIKYISMMDLELFFDAYKVLTEIKLPSSFKDDMNSLYEKMFKEKYGYDYSETVMSEHGLDTENFLQPTVELVKTDGFVVKYYKIPKELLTSKSSEFDYEKYLVKEEKEFNYSGSLSMLVSQSEVQKYSSWDEFCVAFASKYPSPEEELDKVKAVFTQKLCEENFGYYMKYALDKVLEMEQSPEFIACYIKKVRDVVKSEAGESIENFDEKFTTKTNEFLIQNNMEEVFSFYNNSTIEFEKFSYYDMDSCVLPEEYEIIHSTDDYMIMEDGLLVLKVSEGDTLWDAKYGEDETLYLSELPEEQCEKYNQIFGGSEGKYYYAYLHRELNTETIESDRINIYISSTCKTQTYNIGK